MMVECLVWPVAGMVTLPILLPLMGWREFSEQFIVRKPRAAWNWIRPGILWLWIAGLAWLVGGSVYCGDEGAVIAGFGAVAVLLRILSLRPPAADLASGTKPEALDCG